MLLRARPRSERGSGRSLDRKRREGKRSGTPRVIAAASAPQRPPTSAAEQREAGRAKVRRIRKPTSAEGQNRTGWRRAEGMRSAGRLWNNERRESAFALLANSFRLSRPHFPANRFTPPAQSEPPEYLSLTPVAYRRDTISRRCVCTYLPHASALSPQERLFPKSPDLRRASFDTDAAALFRSSPAGYSSIRTNNQSYQALFFQLERRRTRALILGNPRIGY